MQLKLVRNGIHKDRRLSTKDFILQEIFVQNRTTLFAYTFMVVWMGISRSL